ncbi:MAG: bifunctional diaminohydroxyphosphoribosylaminopyrimidine deaminase/5-amino-6-(5-phosphoribosylamino)uracil reductase RibD [Prevotella sp.]|nr:bifunctional diaminohydroxyphosphoribosylaminopyrimidine deaminase/5-amino-6-(5-phosphoribosylamino)uracil reductase RibD [Prevotella sp.]
MTQEVIDEKYMQRCIQLARNGLLTAKPNPMVGAVLVHEGRIIGEGWHVRCGEAHAEVNCFASVRPSDEALVPFSTLYVSLEPCSHYGRTPPCADLIIRKRVPRVVVGTIDPFAEVRGRGIRKLREAGVEVTVGVLESACRRLNKRFFTFHTCHRPFILLKWAQTANGFIGLPPALPGVETGALQLSNAFTRMLVHQLRAEYDAILVGRITDEREHPQLNVRHWSGPDPERIVLSHETDLTSELQRLYAGQRQSLIVEGGAVTLQSFIDQGLWDEIRVETAPFAVSAGTRAPLLPPDIRVAEREEYDGNVIIHYERTPQ